MIKANFKLVTLNYFEFEGYGRLKNLLKKHIDFNPVAKDEMVLAYPHQRDNPNGKTIFHTVFEADRLPEKWVEPANQADALIVPAPWVKEIFENSGVVVPIYVIPEGTDEWEEFLAPQGDFTFLHFDATSENYRKGTDLVIRAFLDLFANKQGVRLILKGHAREHPEEKRYPNIQYIYKTLPRIELNMLMEKAHCFVFPCFSEDTKIMSIDGLKSYSEIKEGDEVLTLNPETHEVERDVVIKKWVKDYEGEMIHFDSSRIDMLVTPNHRIYYTTYKLKGKLKVKKAKFFDRDKKTTYYIPITSKWGGVDAKWTDTTRFIPDGGFFHTAKPLPSKVKTSALMKIIGWYIAEGSIYNPKDGGAVISIANSFENNHIGIKKALDSLGLNYVEEPDKRRGNRITKITINSKHLEAILETCGRGWKNKTIPDWVMEYSPKYLSIMFEAMMKGDGGINGNHITYYTSSEKLKDKVIELCWRLGYSTNVVTRPPRDRSIEGRLVRRENTSQSYAIGIGKKYNKGTIKLNEHTKTKQYKGKVWCIETRNQTVIAHRNGKTFLSGNSRGEGFGLPPLEMMAHAVPTIVSDNSAMSAYAKYAIPIKTEKLIPSQYDIWECDGHWFEPSIDDLKEKMLMVYHNYEREKKRAIANRKKLMKIYDFRIVANQIVNTVHKIING